MAPQVTPTYQLNFLDVIQSPRFVNGEKAPSRMLDSEATPTIIVGFRELPTGKRAANDETRTEARFVVTNNAPGGIDGLGGCGSSWREITAIRLRPDGSFDPAGETIRFVSNGEFRDHIPEVTLVGRMTVVPEKSDA